MITEKIRTLWSLDSDLFEALRLLHGPHDGLHQLLYLFVETSNIAVLLRWLLVYLHSFYTAVIFSGKGIENEVGVLVDTDEVTGLQGIGVDETDKREEDGLSGRGLDDGGLADSRRIQIDVCALF